MTDSYLEKLGFSLRDKDLKKVTIQTVFKCSAFHAANALDGIFEGKKKEKLVIRNMRGFSPLSLVKKISKLDKHKSKKLKKIVLDNLNLS